MKIKEIYEKHKIYFIIFLFVVLLIISEIIKPDGYPSLVQNLIKNTYLIIH